MSADGELPGMWEESDLSGGWADTEDMSARERLIRSVYQKPSQNQMEQLVDAFAHELAERLHALRAIVPDAHKDQAWKDGYAKAVEIAISYIDPMKEGDRG